MLVTNFGLISSTDNGQTWLWSCEQDGNALGMLYQLTPLPRNRLFAVSNQKLVYSDDRSCGWRAAASGLAGHDITDAFLDPVGGTRVMAIGVANQVYSLFQSTDGGATFGPALYQAPSGDNMNGVEFARSDANIVYLALRSPTARRGSGDRATAARTSRIQDLSAALGPGHAAHHRDRSAGREPRAVSLPRRQRPVDRADRRRRHDGRPSRSPSTASSTSFTRLRQRDDPGQWDGRLLDDARPCSARAIGGRRSSSAAATLDPRAVAAQRHGLRGHRQLRRRLRAGDVGGRRNDVAGDDVVRRREGDQPLPQGAVPGDLRKPRSRCRCGPPRCARRIRRRDRRGRAAAARAGGGTIGGGGVGGGGTGGPPPPPKKGGC